MRELQQPRVQSRPSPCRARNERTTDSHARDREIREALAAAVRGVKGSGMPNFLSQLTKGEQARLLEELNYMNLEEIRAFCSARGIPYKIMAKYPSGKVKA